jgi:hypothetical protein
MILESLVLQMRERRTHTNGRGIIRNANKTYRSIVWVQSIAGKTKVQEKRKVRVCKERR